MFHHSNKKKLWQVGVENGDLEHRRMHYLKSNEKELRKGLSHKSACLANMKTWVWPPRTHVKKAKCGIHTCNLTLALRRQRQEDHWSSLASKPNLFGELQGNWRSCIKKQVDACWGKIFKVDFWTEHGTHTQSKAWTHEKLYRLLKLA